MGNKKKSCRILTSSEERQAGKHLSFRQIKMGRENMLKNIHNIWVKKIKLYFRIVDLLIIDLHLLVI